MVCRFFLKASLVAQMVRNSPAMQETWVRSLSWDNPLEEGMATHSSILAWRIPWTEEPGRLQLMRSQRVGHDRSTEPTCAESLGRHLGFSRNFFFVFMGLFIFVLTVIPWGLSQLPPNAVFFLPFGKFFLRFSLEAVSREQYFCISQHCPPPTSKKCQWLIGSHPWVRN